MSWDIKVYVGAAITYVSEFAQAESVVTILVGTATLIYTVIKIVKELRKK
jgi:hypothetical protein